MFLAEALQDHVMQLLLLNLRQVRSDVMTVVAPDGERSDTSIEHPRVDRVAVLRQVNLRDLNILS